MPNIRTAARMSKLTKPKSEPQAQRKFFVVQQHPTSLTTVRRNTQNLVRRRKRDQRKIENRHEDVTQEGESRG